MGACISALTRPDPWEAVVQSHLALHLACEKLQAHVSLLGRSDANSLRKEIDTVFQLLDFMAMIEEKDYFVALEKKQMGVTLPFREEQRKISSDRPQLLSLLDNAPQSDLVFMEAMDKVSLICEMYFQQLKLKSEALYPIHKRFRFEEAAALIQQMATINTSYFNTTFVGAVFSRLEDKQRALFLSSLKGTLSPAQYKNIMQTLAVMIQNHSTLVVPIQDIRTFNR